MEVSLPSNVLSKHVRSYTSVLKAKMATLPLYEGERPHFGDFLDLLHSRLNSLRHDATAKNPSKPEYDSAAVHQFLGGVERVIDGLSTRATEALQGGPQDYVGDSTRSASD